MKLKETCKGCITLSIGENEQFADVGKMIKTCKKANKDLFAEVSKMVVENQKLKDFLAKWEWLDLEDADKTLLESEQKIWEIMQKNAQLGEKDKRIKVLDKALELACANHPAVCIEAMDCSKGVDCVECLVEHYKTQARKELENERENSDHNSNL